METDPLPPFSAATIQEMGTARSLLLLPLLAAGSIGQAAAQTFQEVAASDVGGLRVGHVVAVRFRGEMDVLDAFGRGDPESDASLSSDLLFPFPALTEILVGVIAEALDDAGALDLDAPISSYEPLLSPRLGAIRVRQLLSHSGGLDDARLLEGQSWEDALDGLDDRAMFTAPGRIHSRSRYSFPLALRVIEKAVDRPFREIVALAILDPLEMDRSTFDLAEAEALGLATGLRQNDEPSSPWAKVPPSAEWQGLPVLFTTALDVMRFLTAWMGGGIRGHPPWVETSAMTDDALPGDTGFRAGVTVDRYFGLSRVFRAAAGSGFGAGIYLFPTEDTALMTWGISSLPSRTTRLALERLARNLTQTAEDREEALNRTLETLRGGAGEPAEASPDPRPPATLPSHPRGWAGTYVNGDYKVELREENGGLYYFTGEEEWAAEAGTDASVRAGRPDGTAGVRFQLLVDALDCRYVLMGGKAFLHQGDRTR